MRDVDWALRYVLPRRVALVREGLEPEQIDLCVLLHVVRGIDVWLPLQHRHLPQVGEVREVGKCCYGHVVVVLVSPREPQVVHLLRDGELVFKPAEQ
eukprot:COSAG01_NODE_378_length_17882_cov_62.690344_3_plen_97_part_00